MLAAYGTGTWILAGTSGAVLGLVYYQSLEEIPYTHRVHSVLVSVAQERAVGRAAFAQVLAEARAMRSLLPPEHPASVIVRRVGTRVAAVASDGGGGGEDEHMRGLEWEFAVVDSDQVNAFVVPGGKVVVYTGLLRHLSSQDELAAVMAHEVAHVVARHPAERMTRGSFLAAAQMLIYLALGFSLPSAILTAGFELPNSRRDESEADAIGMRLAARACYDPSAAADVFETLGRLERAAGGAGPKILRTHPTSEDRVEAIRRGLPEAQELFDDEGCVRKSQWLARALG